MAIKINYLVLVGLFLLSSAIIVSCNQEGRGFALPDGDKEAGKAAFVKLSCNECHSVADIEWKENTENEDVPLGGKVDRIKSYGELVTSVINPSHKVAKVYQQASDEGSKMNNYNEILTVQELVDIVTFLQLEYRIHRPRKYYYPYG